MPVAAHHASRTAYASRSLPACAIPPATRGPMELAAPQTTLSTPMTAPRPRSAQWAPTAPSGYESVESVDQNGARRSRNATIAAADALVTTSSRATAYRMEAPPTTRSVTARPPRRVTVALASTKIADAAEKTIPVSPAEKPARSSCSGASRLTPPLISPTSTITAQLARTNRSRRAPRRVASSGSWRYAVFGVPSRRSATVRRPMPQRE